MSSSRYSAELRPDTPLRRLVLASGAVFAVLGVAVILTLPLPAAVLIAASAGWLFVCARELVVAGRGFSYCRGLRIAVDGDIVLLDPDGVWQPARLLPGSAVLRHVGWILFETNEGRQFAELVRGRCRESNDWRRLQVIWRHIGGTP